MIILKKITKFQFSIESLIILKQKFKHKICYKKKYEFLNYKNNPKISLTTRMMKRSNFLKSYKVLSYFFFKLCMRHWQKFIPSSSNFAFLLKNYKSFFNLDKILFWKLSSVNSMFTLRIQKKKKEKKASSNVIFIQKIKRVILSLNLLKFVIMSNTQKNKKNNIPKLYTPLFYFLIKDKDSDIDKLKLKIYKLKLMRMFS